MIARLPRWIWRGVALLSFCAGYVNAVALSGFSSQATSHVTGSVTSGACAIVKQDYQHGFMILQVVIAFFSGAVLSGIIVKNEQLKSGRRYGVALMIESSTLFLATYLFSQGSFSGEWVASFACGLQNALVATYSGSVIRTTHLTGILSDLGSACGNFLAGRSVNRPQVKLHSAILAGFVAGAVAGATVYYTISYLALLIPATIIALSGIAYMTFVLRAPADPLSPASS